MSASFALPKTPVVDPRLTSVRALMEARESEQKRSASLSRHSWLIDSMRYDGSIIPSIVGPVLTHTIFSAAVATAYIIYGQPLRLTNSVVPLISVVVGLLLVFRNGSSYDRWWEGRKDLGQMISALRNAMRLIRHAPLANTEQRELQKEQTAAIRLCVAFAAAVKHHFSLRGEPGIYWHDYDGLLPPDFKYTSACNTHAAVSFHDLTQDTNDSYINNEHPAIALPVMIAHHLTRTVYRWKTRGWLDNAGPAGTNALVTLIGSALDQMQNMERVARTPIPISYVIHIKQVLTLYLCSLPFTLVNELGWKMIPVVSMVAFTLAGIEAISEMIAQPFGCSKADLPLDLLVAELLAEAECVISTLNTDSDELVF